MAEDAALVAQGDVPEARRQQEPAHGQPRRPRAVDDHLHVLFFLAHHLQGVGEPRQGDHGGAVLVVVEDGDVAALLQLLLDLKAPGGGDVLQVDAPEGAGDELDGADDLVHVVALDAQGEGVHPAELLEEHAFALHHRHARLGADVPQAQHRRAVGDHQAQVPPPGQLIALVHILLDLQAGLGHAGGIGQGEIVGVPHLDGGDHLNLALFFIVELQTLLRNGGHGCHTPS